MESSFKQTGLYRVHVKLKFKLEGKWDPVSKRKALSWVTSYIHLWSHHGRKWIEMFSTSSPGSFLWKKSFFMYTERPAATLWLCRVTVIITDARPGLDCVTIHCRRQREHQSYMKMLLWAALLCGDYQPGYDLCITRCTIQKWRPFPRRRSAAAPVVGMRQMTEPVSYTHLTLPTKIGV